MVIVRRPGCLGETLWAFRPILADGLVLSSISWYVFRAEKGARLYVYYYFENRKAGLPALRQGAQDSLIFYYQLRVPWHPGEQERVVALKFKLLTTFFTPLLCVAAFTVVEQ